MQSEQGRPASPRPGQVLRLFSILPWPFSNVISHYVSLISLFTPFPRPVLHRNSFPASCSVTTLR